MDYVQLYEIARDAMVHSYAPFSGFSVGAALLTADGSVFTGVNVENSSYGATICAERTAFVKAISEGVRDFKALAVTSSAGQVSPCGICRQFMFEFGDELEVITGSDSLHLQVCKMSELLPQGFRLNREHIR